MKLTDFLPRRRSAGHSMQTARATALPTIDRFAPLAAPETHLYRALRASVPIVDAAIGKIVRLCGGFSVRVEGSRSGTDQLAEFLANVQVGAVGRSASQFLDTYLDQLLTYGTAVGEIVTDGSEIVGLYNAPLDSLTCSTQDNPLRPTLYVNSVGGRVPVRYPELILLSALDPQPDSVTGVSLLRGLPFIGNALLRIYESIDRNFERMGNVRFAVNYRPGNDALDKASARQRAEQIAEQWSAAMSSDSVRDFVSVGDVDIKVIGADNQIIDCQVPARLLLEQIVARTGLPPFMLGLSWSSTERMSKQQADILTSELWHYRRILTPVIERICNVWQRLEGRSNPIIVEWQPISLQDELESAEAELKLAEAERIRRSLKEAEDNEQ